jgi:hypothetical protein
VILLGLAVEIEESEETEESIGRWQPMIGPAYLLSPFYYYYESV